MRPILRVLGAVVLSTTVLLSCTDADNPFSATRPFQVQLAPRYAETAASIAVDPITQIRLTVKNATTGAVIQVETLSATDVETPDGSGWEVNLEVTPPPDGSAVIVLVELVDASGETEWSGETGPIEVSIGSSTVQEDVDIFPGPPENLSVEAVEITTAPAPLLEGDTTRLAAAITGGEEGARIVWSSIDATLASVDAEGLVTGLLPGTARIQAAAGPAADTVEVGVLARPDSVLVSPAAAVLSAIGAQVQLEGAVVDARGDTLAGESIVWRGGDPAVAAHLGAGLFEAVGDGQTDATALVASDTTVRSIVPLTVAAPDLRAAALTVGGLAGDTLVEGDTLRFAVAVANDGAGDAAATSLALRALDAGALGTVVADTLHPQAGILAGQGLQDTLAIVADDLVGWPDSVVFELETDATGQVAESDETNNTLRTGVVRLRRSVASVLVTPAADTLTAVGATAQFTAEARDGDGAVLAGRSFAWSSSDTTVATVDGAGLATAVGAGTTTISASSESAVGTAGLLVALPNLVAVRAEVTAALPDTIVEDDSMTVDLAIRNAGGSGAAATTYALQVLDPATLAVVDDTVVALAPLAAGDSLVTSHTFDTDSLSHWPDSVRFRMVVDDGGVVAESNEGDNTSTTGVFQLRRSVRSVAVTPVADTVAALGDTARFTAQALDGNGNVLTGRTATWSSSNTAVATVDASGLATAVDFGTALILATVEGVVGSGELAVERPPPAAGFTREWIGADAASPTSWGVAANWNPSGVPTSADTVLVSSAVASQPVLDGSYSVGALTVESGATLELLAGAVLTALGSVDAGQTITGAGTLMMSGAGTTLSGTVPSVTVTGDVSLSGTTGSTGVVHVTGVGAALRVGAQTLTVSDSLLTSSSGVLVMTDGAGVVQVANGARFAGGDTRSSITAGTLHVGGSFTQASGGSIYAFAASGTHTTLLDGSAAQTVSFASPTTSHFNALEVTNATSPVTLATQTEALGDFALRSGGVIPSGDLRVAGGVLTEPSTSLTLTRLDVGGVMSVGDAYSVGTTRYTGSAQTVQAGLPYQVLEVTGDAALAGATAASGLVRIDGSGATLAVTGQTLTADSLHVDNQGLLAMTSAADTVRIAGGAYFGGRVSAGWLTAGQLEVGSSFTQAVVTDATSFDAGGTHRTVLNGTAAQTVTFGSGSSGFHHLRVENTVGVDFPTPALLSGDFVVGPSAVVSSGDVRAAGAVTTDATSSLTLNPLHVGGVMNVQGTYNVLTTRYTGTGGQVVQAGLPYGALEIWGDAVLGGAVATSGPVTVSGVGVNLNVNGQTLTVGDSLFVTAGGLLTMTSSADVVDVANGARFGGGDTQANLTAGTLRVAGPFTQVNAGTASSFAASGTHTTILDGAALQPVSFTDPASSYFHHLQITNTSVGGVSISGTATAAGDFTLAAGAVLDAAAGTLVTGGQVVSGVSSAMTLQALELVDDTMSIGGSYAVGTTVFAEAPNGLSPQILQQGLSYQNVTVHGVARYPTDITSTPQTIAGNLTVSGTGALFTPGSCVPVTVQGNLATELGGTIQIVTSGLDCLVQRVTVDGNATFGGGSTDGLLTGGILTVAGDFTETATDAFRASGSHRTELTGTATVTFADTQPSQFNDLTVSGSVDVPETAWVGGNFHLTGGGSLTGVGQLGVDGNLTTDAGTTLGVALVRVTGTLGVQGTYSVARIIFSGGTLAVRQEIQPNLPYQDITVEQFAKFPDFVNVDQSLTGNLVIESTGDFRPGACDLLTVGGDLDVMGTLTMGRPECDDAIDVVGSALFRGGDTNQTLTHGTLRVAGDFTQLGTTSTASFSPADTALHRVVLNGTGAQTVSFENPGGAISHFDDLEIVNGSRTITLSGDVYVTGTLTTTAGATLTSAGSTLNVNDVSVDGMTLDNVLFELESPSVLPIFDNVTFSANYSTTDTQFLVRHPGSLTAFAFTGLTFLTIPSSDAGQGFYLVAEDTSADEVPLTVELFSPDPASPGAGTTDTLGGAIITWPAP